MLCTVLHPFSFPREGQTVRAVLGEAVDIPDDQVATLAHAGWIKEPEAERPRAKRKPIRRP